MYHFLGNLPRKFGKPLPALGEKFPDLHKWHHVPAMIQDVISLLHPLRHPLDMRTPLDRAGFWLFYLFFILAGNLLALSGMTLMSRFESVSTIMFSLVAALAVTGFGWLILAFQAAIVRRMRDAGFKARTLAALWVLAIAYLAVPANFPSLSLALLGSALALALYIFVGLVHRSEAHADLAQEAP